MNPIFTNNDIDTMFDEFDNKDNNIIESLDHCVTIFTQANGRKTNTYTIGLELTKNELKTHLKTIKKQNGCNGTIKTILYDGVELDAIHLQGNQINVMKKYLVNILKISEDTMEIKD